MHFLNIPDLSEGQEGYIVQERPQLSVKTSADRGGKKKVRRKIQKRRTGTRRFSLTCPNSVS